MATIANLGTGFGCWAPQVGGLGYSCTMDGMDRTPRRYRWSWLTVCLLGAGCGPAVSSGSGSPGQTTEMGTTAPPQVTSTPPMTTPPMVTTSTTTATTNPTAGSGTATTSFGSSGGLDFECFDAETCTLFDTCCDCTVLAPGEAGVDSCPNVDCAQGWCEANGVNQVQCSFGTCTLVKASCNPAQVVCDALPPLCEPPGLPSIVDGCWTGQCIPPQLCDWVPSCDLCLDSEVCVTVQTGPNGRESTRSCVQVPSVCGATADCDCGWVLCEGLGDCVDGPDNRLTCLGA